jgi:hypothetical protein
MSLRVDLIHPQDRFYSVVRFEQEYHCANAVYLSHPPPRRQFVPVIKMLGRGLGSVAKYFYCDVTLSSFVTNKCFVERGFGATQMLCFLTSFSPTGFKKQ